MGFDDGESVGGARGVESEVRTGDIERSVEGLGSRVGEGLGGGFRYASWKGLIRSTNGRKGSHRPL